MSRNPWPMTHHSSSLRDAS